jgi:beta-glucanase (GH16 family)
MLTDNGSKEYVTTQDGCMVIRTKAEKTHYPIRNDRSNDWFRSFADDYVLLSKNYTSGMVMSWNKFCFTGGILEMSISLPGDGESSGLWPAAWLLGNLGRAGFSESTMVRNNSCFV